MSTDPRPAPAVSVTAPDRLPVWHGQPAVLPVQVANQRDEPVAVSVRAVGTDAGPSQHLTLPPRGTATVELTVTVPAGFPGREQSAAVEVVAQPVGSPADAAERTIAPVALALDDSSTLRAQLDPAEVRGQRRAGFAVELENRGPTPLEVQLRGDGTSAAVSFQPARLTVPAGGRTRVTGTVRRRQPVFGSARRTSFGVVVSTRQRDLHLPAGFTQPAILARGLTGLVAILAVLALWATALAVGIDRVSERAETASHTGDDTGVDDGGATDDGEPGGGSDGAGGGGEAGGGDGPAGEAGDEEPASAAASVRIGGTVRAKERGGVTVTLEPVSLAEGLRQGAELVSARPTLRMASGPAKQFGRSARAVRVVSDRRSTTTDVDGAWAFGGVRAPGLYLLTFSKPGYETQKFIVEAAEGEEPPPLEVALEAGKGTITGRVVDERGAGVGGVEVTATDGTVVLSTTTVSEGAMGTFSLEGLSTPGTWSLTTSGAGFGAETVRVDLPGSGRADGVLITVRSGVAAIAGTVTSPEGPVGGLTVEVSDGELTRTATTLTEGAVGSFLVPALPIPGVYTVTVHGEGWQTLTQEVDLRADVGLSLQIRRSSAQLVGTIIDAETGEGIGGVGITLVSDGQTFKSSSAGAEDDGGFELRGIPPGSYVVTFERYGYATEQVAVTLAAGDRVPIAVEMTPVPPESLPDESTITGQVTATTGPVIAGARVVVTMTVATTQPDGATEIGSVTRETTTDGEGNYTLSGLPPGIHRVTASATGHASLTRSVRVGVGASVTLDLALVPNSTLTGRVLSNVGDVPLAGATVGVRRVGEGDDDWVTAVTTAAAEGQEPRFTFSGATSLETGTYELAVLSADDHLPSEITVIQVSAPDTVEQDLRVDRLGHLRVQVREPGGETGSRPLSSAALTVLGPDGDAVCDHVASGTSSGDCPVETAGETILLTGLTPGRYTVSAALDGYVPAGDVQVDVALNQVADAVVLLTPSSEGVSGIVRWMRNGVATPVPNATVQTRFVSAYAFDVTSTFIELRWYETECTLQGTTGGTFTFSFFVSGDASCRAVGFPDGQFPSNVFDFGMPILGTASFRASATGFQTTPWSSWSVFQQVELVMQPDRVPISGSVTLDDGVATPPGSFTGITATVVAQPLEVTGVVEVTVDGQGQVSATQAGEPNVRPGPYTITFAKEGYDPVTVDICVGPGDTICSAPYSNRPRVVAAALRRHGQVVARAVSLADPAAPVNPATNAEDPVNGATFTLTPASGGQARTITAAANQSSVTFEGVSAGSYVLTASHPAYGAPQAANVQVGVGATVEETLVMRRFGSITGRLVGRYATGSPVPLAEVEITAEGPDQATTRFTAVTDSQGRFTIASDAANGLFMTSGTYELTVDAQEGWQAYADDVVVTNGRATDVGQITLQPTPARIWGTVVDDADDETPIVGATVRLYWDPPSGSRVTATTQTDEDGAFELTGLTPALWNLEVSKAGYGTYQTRVDLVTSRDLQHDVTLALTTNVVIGDVEGRYGTKDLPLEGATVTVTDVVTKAEVASTETDEDGTYRIEGLTNGSYEVAVTKVGYQGTETQLDLTGGSIRRYDAVLVVQPRTVRVTVTSAVGGAVDGASVSLIALTDQATDTGVSVTGGTTNPNGEVTFTDVIPGRYRIEVDPVDGHLDATRALTVEPGDPAVAVTASVEIVEAELTGTVTWEDGTTSGPVPAEGATVSVYAGAVDGTPDLVLTTDEDGGYQGYVAPGTYTLVVAYQGQQATRSVTLVSGASNGPDVLLQAPGGVEVTVTDEASATTAATVVLTDASGEDWPATPSGSVYVATGLPPGSYTVTATLGQRVGTGTVTVEPGQTAATSVALPAPPPPPPGG